MFVSEFYCIESKQNFSGNDGAGNVIGTTGGIDYSVSDSKVETYSKVLNGECNPVLPNEYDFGSGFRNYSAVLNGEGCNTTPGNYNFIGGGCNNNVNANACFGFIGGCHNINDSYASIMGGCGNTIHSGGVQSVIAGGGINTIDNSYSAISGGSNNCITKVYSVIAGGASNTVCGIMGS